MKIETIFEALAVIEGTGFKCLRYCDPDRWFVGKDKNPDVPANADGLRSYDEIKKNISTDELIEFARKCQLRAFW